MQLAQLNIADAKFETDQPEMVGFTSRIGAINALADRQPGFVWRMVDDGPEDGALSLRMEGHDPMRLVNMSVWESVEALYAFVYKTAHAKVMRGKAAWFTPTVKTHMVLWWIEDGHRPNLDEAREKLDLIRAHGPSPEAFSFTVPFDDRKAPDRKGSDRKAPDRKGSDRKGSARRNGPQIVPPMGRKDCA